MTTVENTPDAPTLGPQRESTSQEPSNPTTRGTRRKSGSPRCESVRSAGSFRSVVVTMLRRPLASFHLVVGLTVALTIFGLVMVLSASSVEGYSRDGSAYGLFTQQVVFAVFGSVLFYASLRLSIRFMRRIAAPALILTTVMLMLVLIPGLGNLSGGARRWFVVAGFSVQPSELVKVALCLWGSHLLASRIRDRATLRELLMPLVPVALLICTLIILEPNLSTTITIAIIVGTQLWFAGLQLRVFAAFVIAGATIAIVLAMVEGYRSERVQSFLGNIDDPLGAGYQARQARFALANGGFFGQGLGQSRAKWNYLPNAHNDFIFAIIGEELGLLGGLLVIGLFSALAYVGLRIALRATDPFIRLLTATITVLISAQALINIGYVIGLLPVTGIQLPLLSAGGTSTFTVLVMLGLMANAARHEPEAVAALSAGGESRLGRMLRLPTPQAYAPDRGALWRTRRVVNAPVASRSGGSRPSGAPRRRPNRATGQPAPTWARSQPSDRRIRDHGAPDHAGSGRRAWDAPSRRVTPGSSRPTTPERAQPQRGSGASRRKGSR